MFDQHHNRYLNPYHHSCEDGRKRLIAFRVWTAASASKTSHVLQLAHHAALQAFVALLNAPAADGHSRQKQYGDQLKQLAAQLLEACVSSARGLRLKSGISNRGDVLVVVLKLLHDHQHQAQQDDELVALLLHIMRELHGQMHWATGVSIKVAAELVRLLFNEKASINNRDATTTTILVGLLSDITAMEPATDVVVQDTVLECIINIEKIPSEDVYGPERYWKHLDRPQLDSTFSVVAGILRDSAAKGQELVLKYLLTNPLAVRGRIVLLHHGAELMLELIERASSPEVVRDLALVFVRDVAIRIPKCRLRMMNVWLRHEKSTSPVIAENQFLCALATGEEQTFVGEALLQTLRYGSDPDKHLELYALDENHALILYLCEKHDLLEIFASLCEERRRTSLDSQIKARIRMLLVNVLEKEPRGVPAISATVTAGIKSLIAAIPKETTLARAYPLMMRVVTPLPRRVVSRAVQLPSRTVEVTIPSLVKRLAEINNEEASRGRDLIASLRVYAAGDSSLGGSAHEIDQTVLELLSDNSGGKSIQQDDSSHQTAVVYFQNLLLFYRDVSGVHLGRSTGIEKIISASAVAQLLHIRGSDIEKLLMIGFLHNELELHMEDPVRCEISMDASAIINVIAEHLDDVVSIAVNGDAKAKQMVRRILTLVARGDEKSHGKLRAYQSWHPSKPALVMAEIFETDGRNGDTVNGSEQEEPEENDEEEKEAYQYSDCSDDEDDAADKLRDDERGQDDGDQKYYSGGGDDVRAETQESKLQELVIDTSVDDDWELV